MKKYVMFGALFAVAAVAASGALVSADDSGDNANHLKARLSGFQENPSVSTTGAGRLDLRIDDEAQTIDYELSYEALEGGAASASHIHLAAKGVNGGVSAFLCGGGTKPACPATEGTVTGTIVASDVIGPVGQGISAGEFGELVRAMRAGYTYVNVHTPRWPGGEIRGQIK